MSNTKLCSLNILFCAENAIASLPHQYSHEESLKEILKSTRLARTTLSWYAAEIGYS